LVDPHQRSIRTYAEKFPELDGEGKFIGYPEDDIRNRGVTLFFFSFIIKNKDRFFLMKGKEIKT
jgi:hypothetical protein